MLAGPGPRRWLCLIGLMTSILLAGCAQNEDAAEGGPAEEENVDQAEATPKRSSRRKRKKKKFVRKASPVAPDKSFAVLTGGGETGSGHDTLVAAIGAARTGDVIEIRVSGEILLGLIDIPDRHIVLMAAAETTPVLVPDIDRIKKRSQPAIEWIKMTGGSLTLAGLAFRCDLTEREDIGRFTFWKLRDTSLRMLYCTVECTAPEEVVNRCLFMDWSATGKKISVATTAKKKKKKDEEKKDEESAPAEPVLNYITHCVFRGTTAGMAFRTQAITLPISQSLFVGVSRPIGFYPSISASGRPLLQLTQNTFVTAVDRALFYIEARRTSDGRPEFEASYNIFVRKWHHETSDPLIEVVMYSPDIELASGSFAWVGTDNGFVGEDAYVRAGNQWLYDAKEEWQLRNPGSEGAYYSELPPFVKKLGTNPIGVSPENFRITPFGKFARGGTDGTSLGAPVRKIGFGAPFDQAWAEGNPLER